MKPNKQGFPIDPFPPPPIIYCAHCGTALVNGKCPLGSHQEQPKGDSGPAVVYPEDAVRMSIHAAFCGHKLLDILYEPSCIVLVFNREPLMSMRLYQTTLETVLPEKPKE
jgi:hypothetical protein